MEYLSRLVTTRARPAAEPSSSKPPRTHRRLNAYGPELLADFKSLWRAIENQLQSPDQRALHHGISRTDLPAQLADLVEALVIEYSQTDEDQVMGACMEYCLQQDVFAKLVGMAAADKPEGIQREVVRLFSSLVVLLDERFLSRQAINRPLARIVRLCVGDADVENIADDSFDNIEAETRSRYGRMGSAEAQGFEDDLVDLMCHVASRIRNSPELLVIFFRAERSRSESSREPKESTPPPFAIDEDHMQRPPSPATSTASTATLRGPAAVTEPAIDDASPPADFPLFSYLLRFAYREGRTGELARAGLLLLVDISMVSSRRQSRNDDSDAEASLSLALADFMLSSDFAEVIGAGLGAVYGLLPSKLALVPASNTLLGSDMYLGRKSQGEKDDAPLAIERSDSPALATQLKLFIALLDFTQDILGRIEKARHAFAAGLAAAPSAEHISIASALESQLITSIRSLFLESIVYPGLLESSEADGSAIAVMSYLSVMLEVIDDESVLAEAVIGWLLGAGDDIATSTPRPNGHRRSKSTALMQVEQDRNQLADSSYFLDAVGRYTLKDLVLGHMTASSPKEVTSAALWLSTTLLARHGRFALSRFLDVAVDDGATAFPFPFSAAQAKDDDEQAPPLSSRPLRAHTLWQHSQELEMYLSLVAILEQGEAGWSSSSFSSTGLDNYISDAEDTLMADSTYQVGLRSLDRDGRGESTATDFPCFGHRLRPRDPLLQAVLHFLRHFFQQPPEVNVALTALLAQLAASPWRSMAGFLALEDEIVPEPAGRSNDDDDDDDLSGDEDFADRNPRRSTAKQPAPVLLGLLRSLVIQVERYRSRVPNFDRFLEERRRGLLFVENLNDALGLKEELPDGGAVGLKKGRSGAALERLWSVVDVGDEVWGSHGSGIRFVELPKSAAPVVSTTTTTASESSEALDSGATAAEPKRQGSFARWFGRKAAPKASSNPAATEEDSKREGPLAPSMPFAAHYDETFRILLEPQQARFPPGEWAEAESSAALKPLRRLPAEAPEQTLIAPKPKKQLRFSRRLSYEGENSTADDSDEDVEYPGQDEAESDSGASTPALSKEAEELSRSGVSLSALLDNVVILEESIKELVAMLQVRRTLGVDPLTLVGV